MNNKLILALLLEMTLASLIESATTRIIITGLASLTLFLMIADGQKIFTKAITGQILLGLRQKLNASDQSSSVHNPTDDQEQQDRSPIAE